ncbi:MAG TPA: hypothetical protein VFZ08_11620, partial [Terriglobia bacterium]|nr:hypothetical protein [Terriglobia bacterium]
FSSLSETRWTVALPGRAATNGKVILSERSERRIPPFQRKQLRGFFVASLLRMTVCYKSAALHPSAIGVHDFSGLTWGTCATHKPQTAKATIRAVTLSNEELRKS